MKSLARTFGIIAIGLIIIFTVTGCDNDSSSPPPKSGIYLGIIGFNNRLYEEPIRLLTSNNRTLYQRFIESCVVDPPTRDDRRDSTALYFAIDTAISRLQSARLPLDLSKVAIITITDGEDDYSLSLNSQLTRSFIQNRVTNAVAHSIPIDVFVVGVHGTGYRPETFASDLEVIASTGNPARFIREAGDDMTSLREEFADIANSLYWETQRQRITVRIPPGYEAGTIIRITFDEATDAANSTVFIEGTLVGAPGTAQSLRDVFYRGLSVSDKPQNDIQGVRSGDFVNFSFEITPVAGVDLDVQRMQQWRSRFDLREDLWIRNTEFRPELGSVITDVHRSSAAVMLLLDWSTSLGVAEYLQMQLAAKNFIDALMGSEKEDSQDIIDKNLPCRTSN